MNFAHTHQLWAQTPFGKPDWALVCSLARSNLPTIVSGWNSGESIDEFLRQWPITQSFQGYLQLDCDEYSVSKLITFFRCHPNALQGVVIRRPSPCVTELLKHLSVFAEVYNVEEVDDFLQLGVNGLLVAGQEASGSPSLESGFVLLQRVKRAVNEALPVWLRGGMGLHTVAAALAAGAAGAVVDSVLSVYPESSLPESLKSKLLNWDGSETAAGLNAQFDGWAVSQDAALSREAFEEYPSLRELWTGLAQRMHAQVLQAKDLEILRAGNSWARAHGVELPIAQGPMTRVSDCAEFARDVSQAGALPFVALSLMQASACQTLMESTQCLVAGKPWGVGVLGFADSEILDPQLKLVEALKPSVLLIAGGRPSQARRFEAIGIPAYLHVPSPGLLDMFVKEGARHFVFEGRECGGHVGPRYSLVLWHQAVTRLLKEPDLCDFHLLFAGGIHDAQSAAMVSAIAAPLVAKGAKVGVLMGTAYMATHEAVSSGAILQRFQDEVLKANTTALIETAPGHAVRMVPSPFQTDFELRKQQLLQQGVDAKDVWRQLEDMTVGRLRVATKGQDRVGNQLVTVPETEQWAKGMYMIGQVCVMAKQAISMRALHQHVTQGAVEWLSSLSLPVSKPQSLGQSTEPVAIVGMSALYPGSPDLEAFWQTILSGKDWVTEVPSDRWSAEHYWDGGNPQVGKSTSKWGGFIEAVPFDPLKYGIPPASLTAIEPIQLLSLEVASAALKDAGYDTRWFDRERTAVIFGAEAGMDLSHQYTFRNLWKGYAGELPAALDEALPQLTEDSFPGVLVNVISGRIANRLGLGGVNYAVTSACASSLTAIELAVKELRAGTSDMVLAGGADFHNSINDYLMFTSVGALSKKGRCRSFDHQADGIALGEGAGVVVLKRLSDAQADGDRIYAVIEGIAGSSDGKGLGLTAPRKEGQKRALTRAYAQAQVLPRDVQLVEAHGTGTVVGDRTELMTLTDVYAQGGALPSQATLGSVKSQIGHTKCAAGIAGLIKVAKALHHRVLPGTQGIDKPNPGFSPGASPFAFRKSADPWITGRPIHRAAVSAFGFGGANFHTVLAAYPPHQSHWGAKAWPAELFAIRGSSPAAVASQAQVLLAYIKACQLPTQLRNLALTLSNLQTGPIQCAWVCQNLEELTSILQQLALPTGEISSVPGVYVRSRTVESKDLTVVYSGQGSQHPGMLKDLLVYFPQLQSVLDSQPDLAAVVYPPAAHDEATKAAQVQAVTDTRIAQPALGAVEWAAHTWLADLNIVGGKAAGHSYGELVALATSGAMDCATLLKLSKARAEAMFNGAPDDAGMMAAVSADANTLNEMLVDHPEVVLANQNSPSQTVIAGPTAAVKAALEALKLKGLAGKPIQTACAFHSPLMKRASEEFGEVLARQHFGQLTRPVYKNRDGSTYAESGTDIVTTLTSHIVEPVRFVHQIQTLLAQGTQVFLEIGPKTVLGDLIKKIVPDGATKVLSLDSAQSSLKGLLNTVAQLAVMLPDVSVHRLLDGRAQPLDLNKPSVLGASVWWVDGGKAWPVKGALPKSAGHVLQQPLNLTAQHSPPNGVQGLEYRSQTVSTEETAILGYLSNMRDLVNAQRDVLMSFLGAPQTAASLNVRPVELKLTPTVPRLVQTPAQQAVTAEAATEPSLDIKALLLDVMAEKTGYPVDSLELDLDLEADLSIDSIKRLEIVGALSQRLKLRAQLNDRADEALEALGRCRTLRALLTCLQDSVPQHSGPVKPRPQAEATAETKPVAESVPNPLKGREVLLEVVSECTGYPIESLDPELDMEADLSIDSIKRLEIIGRLSQRCVPHLHGEAKDQWVEQFHGRRTLKAMMELLDAPALGHPQALLLVNESSPSQADDPLIRYVFQNQALQHTPQTKADVCDRVVILADDRGIATLVAHRLKSRCTQVDVLSTDELSQSMSIWTQAEGLVVLQGLDHQASVLDVKCLFPVLKAAAMGSVRNILNVAGLGGQFDAALGSPHRGAALAGLSKTMAWEYPNKTVRYLDVDPREADERLADQIAREFTLPFQSHEVALSNGERWTRGALAQSLASTHLKPLPLSEDSVVLLTGGARGITALVAIELAKRTRCTIELVGRSAWPQPERPELASIQDPLKLRQVLVGLNPGKKPAEIEKLAKQVLADREIRHTAHCISAAGGRLSYTALDVRDSAALGRHLDDLQTRYGRIDGVIHGAGILEDKLIADKTPESFNRVFDTKVCPALTLKSHLKEETQFVVFFSSVASAFGNRGQVDYASANSALDGLAQAWNASGQTHVLSVNWGPWAGTGMVSEGLKKEYDKKGIGLVAQQEGVSALLDELCNPRREAQVILMAAAPESMRIPAPQFEVV